jgi:hypothetical protein
MVVRWTCLFLVERNECFNLHLSKFGCLVEIVTLFFWWENLQIGLRIFSRFIVNYALHYPKLTMCPLIGFLQRIEMFFARHRLIL